MHFAQRNPFTYTFNTLNAGASLGGAEKKAWDSKPPTGLSNDDTHLKPGMTKKDVRGVTVW
ncbi:hypothetical protein GQ600_9699 [Phytophthora cactorum]|nr:hypothetical protein GQ600_9699 [Phytophthora cactorum]